MKHTPKSDFSLLESVFRTPPRREVLPNGAVVIACEDFSAPVASVQVWVQTGSAHEGALGGSGVSHFVEHMLFKGTTRRAGREISAQVQAHGGNINAYTSFDRTVYYIDLPSEHVGLAFDVLSDAVLNSLLPEEEFAKERDVILREIDMGRDDPDSRFSQTLFETAFRVHPFRHPIIGYRDVFSALTREDLHGYYRERYVPNNLVVVVAGAVGAGEVVALANKWFGEAKRRRITPVFMPEEPPVMATRIAHRFEPVDVTRAALSWLIPGISHPDAPALDLLAVTWGGGESAELWQTLREKERLVHSIDAHCWTPAENGLFSLSFLTEAKDREAAAARIRELLADVVKRGFGDDEISRAKRQMIVSEINSRKTMSGQAGRLGVAETVAGDLGFGLKYFDRLKSLGSEDLERVAKKYLLSGGEIWVSQNPVSSAPVRATGANLRERTALEFERIDFPNGARLLLQQNSNLPNLHLRVGWLGGSLAEEANRRGATSLLATLLTKDTARRSALDVAAAIEGVGGSFYPFSGNNTFGIAIEVLSSDVGLALELLEEAVVQPSFEKRSFEVERDSQLAALRQDEDDIVSHARRSLRQRFFGPHPLAVDSGGKIEDLHAMQPEDIRRLWERCKGAGNLVLSVVGDFDRATLVPKLTDWLSRLPAGSLEVMEPSWSGPDTAASDIEKMQREQAVVLQAFPGPGVHAEDYLVSEVADELFSGMSSRLFERVREEKGLAYFVRSTRIVGVQAGMFGFIAGTRPDKADEVLAEMDAEVDRMAAGEVEEAELARCKVRLKAGRKMALQTNGSRAMLALTNTLYGYPVNDWCRYDERVEAVSVPLLQDFARNRLSPTKRVRLIVGP
ncbi:MAG: pitrilysin family protein [Opitutaceae bacterium]|nr:pitrilysin family protein [Opitutaceae bacterium]